MLNFVRLEFVCEVPGLNLGAGQLGHDTRTSPDHVGIAVMGTICVLDVPCLLGTHCTDFRYSLFLRSL
jgi:hypothetical protein